MNISHAKCIHRAYAKQVEKQVTAVIILHISTLLMVHHGVVEYYFRLGKISNTDMNHV